MFQNHIMRLLGISVYGMKAVFFSPLQILSLLMQPESIP